MRIVSIHAHPDDAEILAGGTLALLSQREHEIVIVSLSASDCGSATHGSDETASIPKAEATEAAAVIGATYRWGGFRDLAIFNDDPSRRMVTGLIRELRPDIVLTAAPSNPLVARRPRILVPHAVHEMQPPVHHLRHWPLLLPS